jgi:hypothetical protein
MNNRRRYVLDLSEVQKEMVPGALAALKEGISMEEARESFVLTLIDVAVRESKTQAIAARRLGVTPALIDQALHGKVYARFRKKKGSEQK